MLREDSSSRTMLADRLWDFRAGYILENYVISSQFPIHRAEFYVLILSERTQLVGLQDASQEVDLPESFGIRGFTYDGRSNVLN